MKLLFTFLITSLGLMSFSCDSTKKAAETITERELSGTYKILEIMGKEYAEESLIMELETTSNTFNANTPCNSVFGEFTLKENSMQFGSIGATKMYCEGKMQPEKDLATALKETGNLSKERGILIFYSAESDKVLLRAVDIIEEDEN